MSCQDPPDGGARAWLVAAASFLCNGLIFGIINTYGVVYVTLQEEISLHEDNASSKAALVGALAIGTTFLFSILAGILVDRIGIRITAFIGGALATTGMFLSSFAIHNVKVLYLTYGLLLGGGASLAYTPSLVILGHYFEKYMGLVNGVVCAGSSAFTIFMPFLITTLLEDLGLKYTFLILSAMLSVLIFSSMIFKPLHDPKPLHQPKSIINLDNWKQTRYVIWALTIPFTLLGYFVPYVHAVKFVEINFPDSNGSILVLCIGISSGIGRLVFGRVADIPGVDRILLQQVSFVLIGCLTMLMTVASSFNMLLSMVLVMGLFDGCFITLLGPIAYDLCGKSGAGQAIGCLLGLCSVPLTLGPPLAGLIFDMTGSYRVPFLLSGIPPIVGGILLSFVRCAPSGDTKHAKKGEKPSLGVDDPAEKETLFEHKGKPIIITNSSQHQNGATLA